MTTSNYDSKYIDKLEEYSKVFNNTFMDIIARVRKEVPDNKDIQEFEEKLRSAKREDPTYLLCEFYLGKIL